MRSLSANEPEPHQVDNYGLSLMRFLFDGLSNHRGVAAVVRHIFREESDNPDSNHRICFSDIANLAKTLTREEELFDVLVEAVFETSWVGEVRAYKRQSERRGLEWRLGECCFSPGTERGVGGHLGVAMHAVALADEVTSGDVVNAGFAALWTHDRGLSISPRVFRRECTNGMIGRVGSTDQVTLSGRSVAEAIDDCLSVDRFEETVEAFRLAKGFRISDPLDVLGEIEDERVVKRVMARYRESTTQTAWELGNAVTAEARFESDPARRFDLERIGARILFRPLAGESSARPSRRVHRLEAVC